MKTITLRELHAKTGQWVRQAAHEGQIVITDRGRTIARLLPDAEPAETPYFGRRKFISAAFQRLLESGRLGPGGTDSTIAVSEEREDRS